MNDVRADLAVIGGGIVGLATAITLQQRHSDLRVVVLEAEARVSMHQSGNNSGVLHAGLYYKPGSVKAATCRAGKAAMEAFCQEEGVAFDRCGKVVVATTVEEIPRLDNIAERARRNGVEFHRIDAAELRELEPFAAGLAALHVPETGIVDYRDVCEAMARRLITGGGSIRFNFAVDDIRVVGESVSLRSRQGDYLKCDRYVNCGGLQCDRVYALSGESSDVKIVPFRGEYFELQKSSEDLCRNLIYPVPDPSFPFLGVHFTRMIDGGVECGPNAVLAMSRGGYSWRDWSWVDLRETLAFSGFQRLARQHWKMGLGEIYRSVRKKAFVEALQKLIPSIRPSDLKPGRSGVRAQAITPGGDLVDDFLIKHAARSVHVLNAPSPAATASLAIAERIADELAGVDSPAEDQQSRTAT